jgi:hypothetical protein
MGASGETMPREYKLRLGDGTVLAVDEQGLRTWAIDGKAMAQAVGSAHWRPLKEVLAEVAASAPASGRRGKRDDGIPVIPLKRLDDGPPPAVKDLPALRLAAADEEGEPEDLYEGNSVAAALWLWTKRLVLVAGLVGGGVVAANTWPTWLPVVTQFGLVIFTKVDEYVHPERAHRPAVTDERQRQVQEALGQAREQLPYLSPETVQLVLSASVWSVPDPPEVFNRAYTAARRGSSTLVQPEAEELKALETALVAGLRPAERQRVHEYDRVRLERATLPSEDREMLGLYARGTRALPAPSRERLRVLFGKAVAAGLASGGA